MDVLVGANRHADILKHHRDKTIFSLMLMKGKYRFFECVNQRAVLKFSYGVSGRHLGRACLHSNCCLKWAKMWSMSSSHGDHKAFLQHVLVIIAPTRYVTFVVTTHMDIFLDIEQYCRFALLEHMIVMADVILS